MPTEIYAKLLDLVCELEDFKSNRLILESSCEIQSDFQQALMLLAGVYFTIGKDFGLDEDQQLVEEISE
ncbi:MAG: hypothetical protein PUP93_14460 [Rhizonema sp. NSF051]|nr:hypothetical protein [Rhizonema sp. NSF051]